jgi:hypothetical protein
MLLRIAPLLLLSITCLISCHRGPGVPAPTGNRLAPGEAGAFLALANKHQNRLPDDSGLWAEPAISSRLQALLGPKYRTFFGCLDYKAPARVADGVLYVTGSNFRDRTYAAVFALKLSSGELYVRLRERGQDTDFPQGGAPFALPEAVRRFAGHWSIWPESQALGAGHPFVTDQPVAHEAPASSRSSEALTLKPIL